MTQHSVRSEPEILPPDPAPTRRPKVWVVAAAESSCQEVRIATQFSNLAISISHLLFSESGCRTLFGKSRHALNLCYVRWELKLVLCG